MRQRYENESHSQLVTVVAVATARCFLCVKDTKMKAIHNVFGSTCDSWPVVFYASKIRKWKPFTTFYYKSCSIEQLFSMRQRYENESHSQLSGIQPYRGSCCFLCVKDTKMKAIHNNIRSVFNDAIVVFYASKIRKWKPFTTHSLLSPQLPTLFSMRQRYENESHSQRKAISLYALTGCFLCVKDTKMKAIHNQMKPRNGYILLFSMRQRYENESHSQPGE